MNRIIQLFLFLLTCFHFGYGQTQEEMSQKIANYIQDLNAIRQPVIDQYNAYHKAAEQDKPYEMQAQLGELRKKSDYAIAQFAQQKGYLFGLKTSDAMSAYVKVFRDACDKELKEILDLYMKSDRTQSDGDKVKSLESKFTERVKLAEDKITESHENLFVEHWAGIVNKELCQWLEMVLSEVENGFEGFRGESHPMSPKTWYCKQPFPGAQTCNVMDLFSKSVSVRVANGKDFAQMAETQQAIYFYIRSCVVCEYAYSRAGLQSKEQVDSGSDSVYEIYPKGAWQFKDREWVCKVSLRKSLGEYVVMVDISLPLED